MRSIYIALLVIGFFSLSQSQRVAQTPLNITIVPAVSCNDTNNVTGCSSCVVDSVNASIFNCVTATNGYFVNSTTKQAQACPRACTKCSENVEKTVECSECQMNAWFNAPVGSVGCQTCKAGYTLDNGLTTNTNLTGICISVAANGVNSCQTGFWWDSLPNTMSKCVANITGSCATGYNTTNGAANITSNCNQCAANFTVFTSQAQFGSNQSYYWTTTCQQAQANPVQPNITQCTATTTSTDQCTKCENGKCTAAKDGFYVGTTTRLRSLTSTLGAEVAGMVYACPRSCATCTNGMSCASCNPLWSTSTTPNTTTGYCNCDKPGYTSSVPYSTVKINTTNNFACIQQSQGQTCDSPYVWSSQIIPPAGLTGATCIPTWQNQTCYDDTRTDALTNNISISNFWNMPPASNRVCIPQTFQTCQAPYTQYTNGTATPLGKLTANCANCTSGYNLIASNGNNDTQMCQSQNSSIITMSLFLLGLLLSIMF